MKKLILVICLLLIAMPCYATIVEVGGGTITTVSSITSGSIDSSGFSYTPVTKTDTATIGAETDHALWTPASGKKIVLMGVKFSADTATTLLVETGTTPVIPTAQYTASGILTIEPSTPIWQGAINEALTYTTGTASSHSILVYGYEK